MTEDEKQILNDSLQESIRIQNVEKLQAVLPLADENGLSKELRFQGYMIVGENHLEDSKFVEATINLNKARIIFPDNLGTTEKLRKAFLEFFEKFKNIFSINDLLVFEDTIIGIFNYYSVYFPAHQFLISGLQELLEKIRYRAKYLAVTAEETAVTFKVKVIHDALYGDMTIEEMRAEFARIIEPALREKLKEKEEEKSPKSKRKDKKDNKK